MKKLIDNKAYFNSNDNSGLIQYNIHDVNHFRLLPGKSPEIRNDDPLTPSMTKMTCHPSNDIFSNGLWTDNIAEAKRIQGLLKKKIKITPIKKKPNYIAGIDAAFVEDKIIAAAAIYSYPELAHLENTCSIEKVTFPYIPGFLSFREGHSIIEALKKLQIQPDVILFDGQGIAHPRGIGIASHIGVILNIPSIGCAKSRLVGYYQEPDIFKGSSTNLFYKGENIGAVLRTRANVKPVFVSPGHLTDIETSLKIIMDCVTNFRMPEPLRIADRLSKELKKKHFLG